MVFHEAAIVEAGQRIEQRQFDRLLHLFAQAVGVALLAQLRAHPRQQFVAVDRARQAVVDAEFERAQHALTILEVGDDQDGKVARALERADLAAQPQPVVVAETEADDDEVDIVLGRLEQRLVRVRLDVDVVMGAQRLGQALGGTGAIVDDQDAAAPAVVGVRRGEGRDHAQRDGGVGAIAQFVDHHLEPGQRTDARDQRDLVDRLGEEIVGAGFQPAHAVRRLVERGDHDDRQVRGRELALQPAADLEAVHARHHDVEQDDVAQPLLADRDRVRAVGRGEDVEIFRGEARLEQLDVGKDVVDDEDARGHRFTWLRGNGRSSRRISPPRSVWRDRPRIRPAGFFPRRPSWRRR